MACLTSLGLIEMESVLVFMAFKAAHRKFFHFDQGSKEDSLLHLSSSYIAISSNSDDSDSEFESADSSKEASRAIPGPRSSERAP